jgi:polyisoprenoid-binding protein YceI
MYFDTLTTTGTAGSLASGPWILDPERSSLEFRVPLLYGKVGTVKGAFECFRGTLDLEARPAIELSVAADSIDTGNRRRDEHLRSADFFDADAHPEVRFESESQAEVDQRRLGMTYSPLGMLRPPARLVLRGRLVRW